MPRRASLRLLADYLAATRNEIAVDEMFLAMSNLSPTQVGRMPRVPRWIGLAARWPALTRTSTHIARWAWPFGGALLFFALEYLRFSYMHRSAGTRPRPSTPPNGAVLGLSTRVCDIVQYSQFPAFPRAWLTLPWAPQHRLPDAAIVVPLLSLLDQRDLRQAFADAMTSTWRMWGQPHLAPWVLQSYTAFRWFLTRRAVDRLSGTLVTTEHFDRWAVLADRSIREARRAGRIRRRMVVVQHGALGALDKDVPKSSPSLSPPSRLSQVDELHAYNPVEEAAFRKNVLTRQAAARRIDVHFFKPDIELTGDQLRPRLRILFVGHPLCEQFQVATFHALRDKNDVDAYYKPHPKAPMSSPMSSVGWTIVDNPQVFPRVDLLVSYPSTLVIEYEGHGVPASVHSLGASREELLGFLMQTQRLIESCAPNKERCVRRAHGPQ